MKEHIGRALRSFTAAMACAGLSSLAIALMLTLYDIERSMTLAALPWAALTLLQAFVCQALLSRSTTLLAYTLLNGALTAFGVHHVVTGTVFIPGSEGFPILLGFCAALSMLICAFCAQHQPGSDVFIRCTDALIIAIILLLVTASGLQKTPIPSALLLSSGALLLCVLMTAALRAGGESDSVIRGSGAGGCLVLFALLTLCLLSALALTAAAGGRIDGLVSMLMLVWSAVSRVLKAGLTLLAHFTALIAPKPRYQQRQALYTDEIAIQQGDMLPRGAAPDWVVYLFLAVVGAVILVLLVLLALALHGKKLNARHTARRRRKVTRTSHFLSALLALCRRISDSVSFEIAYRFGRRSPQRLLILAQRTGRLRLLPRRKSESGGAYIRRLHGVLLERGVPSGLDILAEKLDRALYSDEDVRISAGEFDAFAMQIRQLPMPHPAKAAGSKA
ncbi:MAG: hypothetical protein IJN79_09530 [Clostridia bacterium]|nr:hypothetical protein [Clostridia bacterium]